jgi:hypothetical protein
VWVGVYASIPPYPPDGVVHIRAPLLEYSMWAMKCVMCTFWPMCTGLTWSGLISTYMADAYCMWVMVRIIKRTELIGISKLQYPIYLF